MPACVHDVHLREDCAECDADERVERVRDAYARGRADERADVVAWASAQGYPSAALARGAHVDAAKKDKP